jgi:hypothetical protein
VAGGLKEELSVTAEEADAFSQLVENARRPRPKPEFGGGALERRSISEQAANRILHLAKKVNLSAIHSLQWLWYAKADVPRTSRKRGSWRHWPD